MQPVGGEHVTAVHYGMSIITQFTRFCRHLLPSSHFCVSKHKIQGEWKGVTAGGCSNHDTWRNNPQYLLSLKQKTTVHILLAQPELRSREQKKQYPHIGFYVAKTTSMYFVLCATHIICNTNFFDSFAVLCRWKHEENWTPTRRCYLWQ